MAYHNKNTQYPGNVLEKNWNAKIFVFVYLKKMYTAYLGLFFLNLIAFLVEIVSFW